MRLGPRRADTYADWRRYMAERAETTRSTLLKPYYGAALPPADSAIADVPLMALDIETTGLDAQRDAIVSIGLIPFTTRRIHLARRRYWIIHPTCALNSRSVTLHHITHTDIERAPYFSEILPELLNAMRGHLPVVHYRTIERSFLDRAVTDAVGEPFGFPTIDTMELEARRYRTGFWSRWRGRFGGAPVSIRLHDSRVRYHLPHYQAHHALVDALATAELLQAQIATHFTDQAAVRGFCT